MKDQITLLKTHEAALLTQWIARLDSESARVNQILSNEERERYSRRILVGLIEAFQSGILQNIEDKQFDSMRHALEELSVNFAERGLTPSETATFIFSLKEVIFSLYKELYSGEELAAKSWEIGSLIDKLGLFTFEAFAHARERIIRSQAEAIADLATPVIKVWDGIIALPLVGSIDSARAKDIMEKLLDAVIAYGADIVIIDITGVPVVDTQVANRIMRTVEAVRLLGTQSIVTGINPIIAQTLVQLGVQLSDLVTKSSLQAGLQQAFRQLKITVSQPEGQR